MHQNVLLKRMVVPQIICKCISRTYTIRIFLKKIQYYFRLLGIKAEAVLTRKKILLQYSASVFSSVFHRFRDKESDCWISTFDRNFAKNTR